jgi:16S rRNA (guanine1207-N2)-methyltransferase
VTDAEADGIESDDLNLPVDAPAPDESGVLRIHFGHGEDYKEQSFFDGKLVIVSRDGLNFSDRAVMSVLPKGRKGRALVIGSYRGIIGYAVKLLNPEMEVTVHYLDAWAYMEASHTQEEVPSPDFKLNLAPDPPPGPYDLVVIPMEQRGIADLVREQVRLAASTWLKSGGVCITSSDTTDDKFIRGEMKKAFGAFHIAPNKEGKRRHGGVAYVARKPAVERVKPPKSWTEYTYARLGKVLEFKGRIGVFCHDRLDPGTRALLHSVNYPDARRILDLGCGTGIVGTLCALESPEARVTFLDSNARAIESAKANAEFHGISSRCEFVLSDRPAAALGDSWRFDLIVTNPPYYGNRRIAEMFIETARNFLEPEGKLLIVTKDVGWYVERLESWIPNIEMESRGGYQVLIATRQS